jgi:hypothetical protein
LILNVLFLIFKNGNYQELTRLWFAVLLKAYKWLVCYLTQSTVERLKGQQSQGKDAFTAKNDSQVFFARTLSIAFVEVGE